MIDDDDDIVNMNDDDDPNDEMDDQASDDDDGMNDDLIQDNWREDVITDDDPKSENDRDDSIDENDPQSGTRTISKDMIADLIKKCRILIKTINHSHILTDFITRQRDIMKISRRLAHDCVTRWNSTFYLLESLIQNKSVLLKLFNDKHHLSISLKQQKVLGFCELSSDEWTYICHLLHVLKPFREATDLLSGSKYPSIGLCLFTIRTIKDYLEVKLHDESNVSIQLKNFLLESMNHYFDEHDHQYHLLKVSSEPELFYLIQLQDE